MRASLKYFAVIAVCTLASGAGLQSVEAHRALSPPEAVADDNASPIYGVTIPAGFRDWRLISVAHEAGNNNDLRAVLGNDIAIKAYREGKLPFPDGAIIARLAWTYTPSDENDKVLGPAHSFVAGPPINLQLSVKDSRKYASTGGWGFADFTNGKAGNKALHENCFTCHQPARDRDYVFTRYAPTP